MEVEIKNLDNEIRIIMISGGYMTGTSTLEVYDADILVAETGMIVCSMQVIKGDVREAILYKKM